MFNTVDTTRVSTRDPFSLAVWNSRLIYPSPDVSWSPKVAVVASNVSYHYAMAGATLIHHPINATHLLTHPASLPQITIQELIRLRPRGEGMPAQVLLIGPTDPGVTGTLRMMGFSVLPVGNNPNPYTAAVDIARFRLEVIPPEGETGRKNIIVVSGEDFREGLPAPGIAAHMGTPIIFVGRERIPQVVEAFIKQNRNKNYFILGSQSTVSDAVYKLIASLSRGIVDRIPGRDPFEIAVNFARFYCPEAAGFGWNRNMPGQGDAFNFAPVHRWENAVMSALQSHEGKHTPELTITQGSIPPVTKDYLEFLRPVKSMPMPPFMHGFIQGDFNDISWGTQLEIEESIIFKEKM